MSFTIRTKGDKKLADDIRKMAKELRFNIESELDPVVDDGIDDLKKELLDIVNNQIQTTIPAVESQKDLTKDVVSIPKSDTELFKQLLDIDISKVKTLRDYTSMVDSGITLISNRKQMMERGLKPDTSPMSSGVNLRLPMSEYDTFDSQHNAALKYFNNSTFVIEENGKMKYYMNPGIDLSAYIKVVCSNTPGNSDRAQEVFERYKSGKRKGNRKDSKRSKKDYADWTILNEGLDIVKSKFIPLNEIFDDIKRGDYSAASDNLKFRNIEQAKAEKLQEEINNLKDGKSLKPTTQVYSNLIAIIQSIKVRKVIRDYTSTYTLFTNLPSQTGDEEEDFLDTIKQQIFLWKISNEQKWIEAVVRGIEKAVQNLNKG